MRMTTKGRYALRASIALATMCTDGKPVSIKSISEAEAISPEFLEQIFFKLRKSGLISSVRGPGGGFYFSRPLQEISLKDIVDSSGEGVDLADCACGIGDACTRVADCLAGRVWRDLSAHIDDYLANLSLYEIVSGRFVS